MRREANIEDWRVFCAIAKTGSIHAAADLLGSVDSLVSRTLTGLEKSLGCQLINRDKRPFSFDGLRRNCTAPRPTFGRGI